MLRRASISGRGGILSPSSTQEHKLQDANCHSGNDAFLSAYLQVDSMSSISTTAVAGRAASSGSMISGAQRPPPESGAVSIIHHSLRRTQSFLFYAGSGIPILLAGTLGNNLQQQYNVTDNLSRILGAHQ